MIFLDGISAFIVIILWGIEALRVIERQLPVTCPVFDRTGRQDDQSM